jgi:serine/threonine protein kinase
MNSGNPSQDEILESALLLTGEARAAYLKNAVRGDEQLRQRIQELIEAHQAAEKSEFLDKPPAASVKTLVISLDEAPLMEKAGDTIGHYKLLEELGKGGMGRVWMAEQTEPVRRRVALKVIKLGMDTKEVVARFEAERQALALMDHPNIAKVFDSGATETGRPFFVMELVRGIKITDYCDQNKLSTEERLKLFIQVCHAVQHAHQKGIIHRDISPTNILVTSHDGVPVPKVIDFGIAKAVSNQRLTDKTLFTAFQQFLGKPAYMSPEQAEMSGLDIDTRSDIYSLGVLLYELLTGRTPFDAKTLLQAGLDGMRRIIREQEPQRPSMRLSTLANADLTTVADQRHAEPPKLVHLIRGDLDWVVMKSLEKDRTRRYETANGLAMDIERHLRNEPVQACPPSNLYRFRKFVRRHKPAFAATTAFVVLLVVSLVVISLQFVRARTAMEQAQVERDRAESVVRFVKEDLFRASDPLQGGDRNTRISDVLDTSVQKVRDGRFDKQPLIKADLENTLAQIYESRGEFDKAEPLFREALSLVRQAGKPASQLSTLYLNNLGSFLISAGKFREAEPVLREALAAYMAQAHASPENLAMASGNLANALQRLGKLDEAEALSREALHWSTLDKADAELHVPLCMLNLASILTDRNKTDEAEKLCQEALAIYRKRPDAKPLDMAWCLNNLAFLLKERKALAESERLFRESLQIHIARRGTNHIEVVNSLQNLGSAQLEQQHFTDAEATYRQALSIARKAVPENHPALAAAIGNLAYTLRMESNYDEAITFAREALDWHRRNDGETNRATLSSTLMLADMLIEACRYAEAEPLARQCVELRKAQSQTKAQPTIADGILGAALAGMGRFREAEQPLTNGYAVIKNNFGPGSDHRKHDTLRRIVKMYESWNAAEPDRAREDRLNHWRAELNRFDGEHGP